MSNGYFRVASCIPGVSVGDCQANANSILRLMGKAKDKKARLVVFPEMCITGYTCADLFHNATLLDGAKTALVQIVNSCGKEQAVVVGAPLLVNGVLYNCAIFAHDRKIVAIYPKSYLPNYNEFYEKRWWAMAPDIDVVDIDVCGQQVPFGTRQLVDVDGVKVAAEVCEDLWTPIPPSCYAAMAGAQVIVNLSASDDLIGKYPYLMSLIRQQSARCIAGYAYASAGYGESSTDLVFDGKAVVAENGSIIACNERWQSGEQMVAADIDVMAIDHDRMSNGSFSDCKNRSHCYTYRVSEVRTALSDPDDLLRSINPRPFVPPTDEAMAQRCSEIINIQAAGLAKRLDFVRSRTLVIGISGGLDSTLALLVAVKAFDRLGLDRKGIIGITMPGFGTTKRTKGNAIQLMEELGIESREISIDAAVDQHFKDIGHDPEVKDVTYENSQARERTQILMDVANQENGLVLGTGDLSELALGWATYNGDHMSMYAVNAGVPKTLVKYLVRAFAGEPGYESCRSTLLDIIDTPISPELTPADKDGNIAQKTEDLVGPYDLHDFFLYYVLRFGFPPRRIYMMAKQAFAGEFDDATILKWLRTFFRRFFQQQFKRSCLPDGPKVGSVCLSPRGDWRMPSDASAAMWLKEVDELKA